MARPRCAAEHKVRSRSNFWAPGRVARETHYFFDEAADLYKDRLNKARVPMVLMQEHQEIPVLQKWQN
jgi:hypothetical protein